MRTLLNQDKRDLLSRFSPNARPLINGKKRQRRYRIAGKYRLGIATGVVDSGGAPCLAKISANFRKKLKR
jgi:hypothetical protein